jgi:hypothetical protein
MKRTGSARIEMCVILISSHTKTKTKASVTKYGVSRSNRTAGKIAGIMSTITNMLSNANKIRVRE